MEKPAIDVNNFDDIRPYTDGEVQPAIERLLQDPLFFRVIKYVYPGLGKVVVQKMMREIRSVSEFQENISGPAMKVIAQMTTNGLTFSNMDALNHNKAYLFISNHRDIILDSALLNVSLLEKGYQTTQIAIGDNLVHTPFVHDLVRLNKNFLVNRNVSAKDIFHYSLRLSNYIRHTIVNERSSIWIAQREGRAKDGDDRTATGLLKMFGMSYNGSIEDALVELNIMPMCVSYEYDPCDVFKVNELLNIKFNGKHEKKHGEDFRSMMKGLTGHKGRVNIAVGHPLTHEIQEMRGISNKNDKVKYLTECIDRQMHKIYRLWPTNYLAYDLLNGTWEHKEHYTNIQRIAFNNYIRGKVVLVGLNRIQLGWPREGLRKAAREILLEMYANPVVNKKMVEKDIEIV
ncbi:MAG: 1-acyl-sn-glycerol-3-phosphate acyltransferase [Flavobacteriales bacterium]|nr:1-acyl-sn-glycerol-3-phosphate acyltransferase [Flavobacteriales bacterium]